MRAGSIMVHGITIRGLTTAGLLSLSLSFQSLFSLFRDRKYLFFLSVLPDLQVYGFSLSLSFAPHCLSEDSGAMVYDGARNGYSLFFLSI
jgi:hypothetical protein